jgi:hypothetical protein
MPELVVAHMVEPTEVGVPFRVWPLHMTLVPPHEVPDVDDACEAYEQSVESIDPFEVVVGARAYFGAHGLPVKLVDTTTELDTLLGSLIGAMHQVDGHFTGTDVDDSKGDLKPHVTQKNGRDASGTLHIDEICVVDRRKKEVIRKIRL